MTQSFATKAAFRFGYGFAPWAEDVRDVDGLMGQLSAADEAVARFPGPDFDYRYEIKARYQKERKRRKLNPLTPRKALKQVRKDGRSLVLADNARMLERAIYSSQSFRERLVAFWLDHFTVVPKTQQGHLLWGDYLDAAIRPHVTGRFADLLKVTVTHPSMVVYLDQHLSVGPNSPAGLSKKKGLNEKC